MAIDRARSTVDAVKETHRLICRGYTDVVMTSSSSAADMQKRR